jgi:hypothetical protein
MSVRLHSYALPVLENANLKRIAWRRDKIHAILRLVMARN